MSNADDKDQRIAELEQEVARLRAAAGQPADGAERVDSDEAEQAWMAAGDGDPGDEAADRRQLERHMPSRRRAIVIAVVLGVVALVAIAGIVTALSSVIQPLSKSAAGALEPFEPPEKAGAGPTKQTPPPKAAADPMRVPGL